MQFWTWLDETSQKKVLTALALSMLSGVAISTFVLTLVKSVHDILLREYYGWYLLMLPVLVGVFLYAKRMARHLMALVSEQFAKQQTLTIANYLRHAELAQIETYDCAEIYARLTDVRTVSRLSEKIVMIAWCLAAVFACWFYMLSLTLLAGLAFVVGLFCMHLVSEFYKKLYIEASHAQAAQETEMFSYIGHLLRGYKTLLVNRSKNRDLVEHFLFPAVSAVERCSHKAAGYYARLFVSEDTIYYLIIGVFVFWLPLWYPTHRIFAVLTVGLYAWTLVGLLFRTIPDIAEIMAALERLAEIAHELQPQDPVSEHLYAPSQVRISQIQAIRLHEVRFEYRRPNGTPTFAIGPLTLTIAAGTIIFVSGGNGSGKTTLLKVITGLYPPSTGTMTLNDQDVRMQDHRYLFSAVFNDFHLFDRLYGLEDVDPQRVNALLIQMDLAQSTRWQRGRFTTLNLSAGQQRRLALITALLEDHPMYVFDELAADQSPDFRRYFYDDLLPALKAQGKTVIAVTHDEDYYHIADRVIRMDYGKIIEG